MTRAPANRTSARFTHAYRAQVFAQVLEALAFAHERGFVHRDIKPANMLLEDRGGKTVVRLADFGLARLYETSQLSGVTLPGTAVLNGSVSDDGLPSPAVLTIAWVR